MKRRHEQARSEDESGGEEAFHLHPLTMYFVPFLPVLLTDHSFSYHLPSPPLKHAPSLKKSYFLLLPLPIKVMNQACGSYQDILGHHDNLLPFKYLSVC